MPAEPSPPTQPTSEPPADPDAGLLAPVRAGLPIERVSSDRAYLEAMLDAEAGLARAQARTGAVPGGAARVIDEVATGASARFDPVALAVRARGAGNPVVPLVADLRTAVREVDPTAAEHVHQGATSQDIMDTATMLVAHRAAGLILADLDRVLDAVAVLAERHRDTPMAARTLGRQALPTTFGCTAAGWLIGCLDARAELARAREGLPVQLGGAAGTLAALGGDAGLSEPYSWELCLADPVLPWHTRRTPVLRLGAALSETTAALGKIATDVALLAQTEIDEVAEAAGEGRGGSSALPHKRNPALSVLVRSAALQVPAQVQILGAAAGLADHQRPIGAWHAEWQPLRECLRLTGGAAATTAELVEGLEVRAERMRANLELTGGAIVSERLAGRLGRERVTGLLHRAEREGVTLRDLVSAGAAGTDPALVELLDPSGYLGAAPALTDRALAAFHTRGAAGAAGAARAAGGNRAASGTARLHYLLDGPPDAPVLVLGPSLGTTLRMWEPQLETLTRRWRVLRYDLPGHGGSPRASRSAEPSMEDLADEVLATLDQAGIRRFAAGGVSLGGAVAATLAVRAPDRVTGLVLCCTSARFGEPATWIERIERVRADGMGWLAESAPGRWFTDGFAARHPEVVRPVQDMLRGTDPDGYTACCQALAGYDLRARLAEVAAPTLVIAGEDDPVSPPAHARELGQGIADADVLIVPAASHLANVERPGPVTAAMMHHLRDKVAAER